MVGESKSDASSSDKLAKLSRKLPKRIGHYHVSSEVNRGGTLGWRQDDGFLRYELSLDK